MTKRNRIIRTKFAKDPKNSSAIVSLYERTPTQRSPPSSINFFDKTTEITQLALLSDYFDLDLDDEAPEDLETPEAPDEPSTESTTPWASSPVARSAKTPPSTTLWKQRNHRPAPQIKIEI